MLQQSVYYCTGVCKVCSVLLFVEYAAYQFVHGLLLLCLVLHRIQTPKKKWMRFCVCGCFPVHAVSLHHSGSNTCPTVDRCMRSASGWKVKDTGDLTGIIKPVLASWTSFFVCFLSFIAAHQWLHLNNHWCVAMKDTKTNTRCLDLHQPVISSILLVKISIYQKQISNQ